MVAMYPASFVNVEISGGVANHASKMGSVSVITGVGDVMKMGETQLPCPTHVPVSVGECLFVPASVPTASFITHSAGDVFHHIK